MSQEPPTPPVDPWADASETEQITQPASYPQAPWLSGPAEAAAPAPQQPPDVIANEPAGDGRRAPWLSGPTEAAAPAPQQRPVRPPDIIANEPAGDGRRAPIVVLAVVVVALLLAGGFVLFRSLSHDNGTDDRTGAHGTTGTSTTGQPTGPSSPTVAEPASTGPASTAASATPGTASLSPSPPTPGRPQTPADALALTDGQAATELGTQADENAPAVAALAGSWVPQVDGKCVGVKVDIEPSFVPDGTPETPHVTIQQILAFHLSLHSRFGALTVRQSQLGIGADTATSGPCAGLVIWNSVVPKTFGTAQDANAWCDANVPPVNECLARYVARPGEVSKGVERG